jgi:hypothetical protein
LDPPLEGEEINLRIVDASGIATVETVTTLQNGLFEYLFTPDEKEEWAIIATWLGNTEYESVAAEIRIQIVVERAAIVLLGGGDEVDNPSWRRFNGVAQYVYRILKKRTYSDDDIYFLSPSREKTETIDDVTSKERLQFAILNWAKPRINANTPLFLYMISHNTADRFLIEKQGDQQIFLSVEELAEMLNVLPDVVPVRVVIEACHSANFIIKEGDDGRPLLPRHNRIVIASAKSDQQAKVSDSLSSFSKFFFDYLEDDPPDPNIDSRPLGDAFAETQALMTLHPLHRGQLPQFDAGNGVPNEPDDFVAAKDVFIPENILSLGNPPDILGLTGVTTGATSARITAEVTGAAVERVFVTITPPDYDPTVPFGDDEWGKYDVPIVDLHPVEGEVGHYAAEYDQLTTPGIYTIVAFASNTDGDSALPVQGTIPVSPPAPWDINNDSVVNIFDLVLVGGEFGKTPPDNPATDVTGDGSVNIFDLVTVATHFGETVATAPPAIDVRQTASIHESKHKQIHLALVELEGLRNPSEGAIIARKLLRAWLANATPTVAETKVLQNYPNPFNPETWIPYQLAEPAVVTISIYSATGRRIRTLHLGQQATGFYIEPSKAAYWDGRNRFGESVASGIYFYQIRAGDFSATRRMAIVK